MSVQVRYFGTGKRYKLKILPQCGNKVKTKTQKVLRANSYLCRSFRGKTGRGAFLLIGLIYQRITLTNGCG